MNYEKIKERCLTELHQAEEAGDKEAIEISKSQLKNIEEAIQEEERLNAVADSEEAKSIKLRDILSDYFLKDRNRLNKAFIGRLKETVLRDPITVDEFGAYRKGLFTFGCFIVEVDYSDENHIWEMTIYHNEKGKSVPHDIVKQARRKFIPDHCIMAELYYGRNVPTKNSVTLFEVPGGERKEESND